MHVRLVGVTELVYHKGPGFHCGDQASEGVTSSGTYCPEYNLVLAGTHEKQVVAV